MEQNLRLTGQKVKGTLTKTFSIKKHIHHNRYVLHGANWVSVDCYSIVLEFG